MNYLLLPSLLIFIGLLFSNVISIEGKTDDSAHKLPSVNDTNLKIDIIFQENIKFDFNSLSPVSSMEFIGRDILFLDKNNGTVYRIIHGTSQVEPLLDVNVANKRERGLLGIATSKDKTGKEYVYLYYTESKEKDGSDVCSVTWYCDPSTNPLGNRLYRFELHNNKLIKSKMLLDLPAYPAPIHNGGVIKIGPDKNLYLTIGDLDGNVNKSSSTKSQNFRNGTIPDGRAGILRVDQDGNVVGNGILGNKFPLNLYFAYGIRNSFGIDFDPVTGDLWETEPGPEYGDEINFVKPGFNSGWNKVQGVWQPLDSKNPYKDFIAGDKLVSPKNLEDFRGKGKYSAPEFTWYHDVAPTAIKFFNSDRLGKKYENDLFVGNVHLGTIFHFDLNEDRTELKLEGVLKDKIANNNEELDEITFSRGLGGITDMDVGPDGYLYILSNYMSKATIFRIAPK